MTPGLGAALFASSLGSMEWTSAEELSLTDHASIISDLGINDAVAGAKLYALHCAACHGEEGGLATNPLARRFSKDDLKFGSDPYSLWKTISYGNGLMFRWDGVLSVHQRYQIVHHLRENILRRHRPEVLDEPGIEYLEGVNARAWRDAVFQAEQDEDGVRQSLTEPGLVDGSGGKHMDYGPFLQYAVIYDDPPDLNAPILKGATEKGLMVSVPGPKVVCYDAARLSWSGVWLGEQLADTAETHHTSYKGSRPMKPSGPLLYRNEEPLGWLGGDVRFRGHYLFGEKVILHYIVGQRMLWEMPWANADEGWVERHFRVGAGSHALRCLLTAPATKPGPYGLEANWLGGEPDGGRLTVDDVGRTWMVIDPAGDEREFRVAFIPRVSAAPWDEGDPRDTDLDLEDAGPGRKDFLRTPRESSRAVDQVRHRLTSGAEATSGVGALEKRAALPSLATLRAGGPRRWLRTVETVIQPGVPVEGYAADELRVPLANPYGSWMRLTALGFFSDGRLAVTTLSGDVWIVRFAGGGDVEESLIWSRYATGLYEPLGLEIVDDYILVRGRDRITRLHDFNQDGEADYYENFYEDPREIGAGYHAFSYDLVRDGDGGLIFAQGSWKSPLEGSVIRVSPDGAVGEVLADDFRNPNGLGIGGPEHWLTVADNPSGVALYNGFTLVEKGGSYGFSRPRTVPMTLVLPARVDSSGGGQCWTNQVGWGPLSGVVIHGSYSRSTAFYCRLQDVGSYPNGFAVALPFDLKAGVMRVRLHPSTGEVFLACKRGWDSIARVDGVLYRLRYTGEPCHLIVDAAATPRGIRLTFGGDLEPESIDLKNVMLRREADKPGVDGSVKKGVSHVEDVILVGLREVELILPGIREETLAHRRRADGTVQVNPAVSIDVDFLTADGMPVRQTIHATINSLP